MFSAAAALAPISDAPDGDAEPGTPLDAIRRFGRETVAIQALEAGTQYFRDGHGQGLVAYVDTGSAWVACGAPVAPAARVSPLLRAFREQARAQGRRTAFCAAEGVPPAGSELRAIQLGAQAVWDARTWQSTLGAAPRLREQVRRAKNKGVVVRRAATAELAVGRPLRHQADQVRQAWLNSRRAPPLRFLLDVQPFNALAERRIWVAERDGRMVALLSAAPIYQRRGWFFEDVLRETEAPNGTVEALVDAAMRACAEDGEPHVTFGMVPLVGEVPWWLRGGARLVRRWYDFNGLRAFRERLRPSAWEPISLWFPASAPALLALWDALCALAGDNPLRFAVRSLRRGADFSAGEPPALEAGPSLHQGN